MATADLAVSAQGWIEDEFRDPGSDGVRLLRKIADDVETGARVLVPKRTSRTFDSIGVTERTAHNGTIWFQVLARNPVTDVLNSESGFIRNPGSRTGQLTRTGRRRRSSTGTTVRRAEPFMRDSLFQVTKAGF